MNARVERELLAAMAAAAESVPAPPPVDAAPPASAYADPAVHARELERVFAPRWLPVVRARELEGPGAFATVDVGTERIAVVRGADGALRALHDVCLHRGARILREERGRTDALRCPYHALTYGLDGTLESLPCPEAFPASLRAGEARLPRVASEEHAGWLWVRLAGEGPGLRESLGPDLLDELAEWPLGALRVRMRRSVDAAFDWKVGVEAFLEPLHVPAIHGRTAHPVVEYRGTATRELGPHSRMALPFRAANTYGPDGVLGAAAAAAGVSAFPDLNEAQRAAHLVYLVFPSTIWMLFPNHVLHVAFLPTAPGRCRALFELLVPEAADPEADAYLDSLVPGYERLVREDLENLPWIQRGLADSTFRTPRLSGYERRIPHFWSTLAAALAD